MSSSYADWYIPQKAWQQPMFEDESIGMEFINLKNPQPTADVGSLCGAMVLNNPFASTHWVKIPCEYPLFRAGCLCKKPATGRYNLNTVNIYSPLVLIISWVSISWSCGSVHPLASVCPDPYLSTHW